MTLKANSASKFRGAFMIRDRFSDRLRKQTHFRLALLVGATVVAIIIALVAIVAIRNDTLAQKTIELPSGTVVDFRIWRDEEGIVFASARERRRDFSNGFSATHLLSTSEAGVGGTA